MKNPMYHPDRAHLPSSKDMANRKKNMKADKEKERRRLKGVAHLEEFFFKKD